MAFRALSSAFHSTSEYFVVADGSSSMKKYYPISNVTKEPWACFVDKDTESIADPATSYKATFNDGTFLPANAFSISTAASTSAQVIGVNLPGWYKIDVSAVASIKAGGAAGAKAYLWLTKNTVDVDYSGAIVAMDSTVLEYNLGVSAVVQFNAGEALSVRLGGSSSFVQFLATSTGSNPTRPASPSIIMTLFRVSQMK